jgi:hypothetical protein
VAPCAAALTALFPIRVECAAGRGRYVVAARDLEPGTIVMMSTAAAMAPVSACSNRCNFCLQSPSLMAPSEKMLRCSRCRSVLYCSQACQKADWAEHKPECAAAVVEWLGTAVAPADAANVRLLGRLQGGQWLRKDGEAAAGPIYRHSAEDVLAMCARSAPPENAGELVEKAIGMRLLRGGPSCPFNSLPILYTLLSSFDANNFFTTDELIVGRAASVYPAGALLNHSCVSSCGVTYLSEGEAVAAWEGRAMREAEVAAMSTPGPARAPRVQVIRTLGAVPSGGELTHPYVDPALPRAQRLAHLRDAYAFSCTCGACTAAPGSVLDKDRFLLSTADGGRVASVGVPMPLVDPAHPTAGELSLNDYDTLSTAEASTVRRAQQVLQWAEKVTHLLAIGAPGAAALRGITTKLRNTGNELFTSLPAPLSSLSMETSLEYDSYVIRMAEDSGRLEPGEGGYEMVATRALEAAALSLRTVLHPLHVCVVSAVNVLHQRALMLGDWPAAAAAGDHILAFQYHAYARVEEGAGDGPVAPHPLLGLQLYTQADVLKALANMAQGAAADRRILGLSGSSRTAHAKALFVRCAAPAWAPAGAALPSGVPGVAALPFVSLAPAASPPDANASAVAAYASAAAAAYEECARVLRVTCGRGSTMAMDAAQNGAEMRELAALVR